MATASSVVSSSQVMARIWFHTWETSMPLNTNQKITATRTTESSPWTIFRVGIWVWRRPVAGACAAISVASSSGGLLVELEPAAGLVPQAGTQGVTGDEPHGDRGVVEQLATVAGAGVEALGDAATRERVPAGGRGSRAGAFDPLEELGPGLVAGLWPGAAGVAGAGQLHDDGAQAAAVVVEREPGPALADHHVAERPAGRQGTDAGHHRGRGHRLGHEHQRLVGSAGQVRAANRRVADTLVVEEQPPRLLNHDEGNQQGDDREPDPAEAPALDRDRARPLGQEPEEISVQVVPRLPDHAAELRRHGQAASRRERLGDLLDREQAQRTRVDQLRVAAQGQAEHHVGEVDGLPPWAGTDLGEGHVDEEHVPVADEQVGGLDVTMRQPGIPQLADDLQAVVDDPLVHSSLAEFHRAIEELG